MDTTSQSTHPATEASVGSSAATPAETPRDQSVVLHGLSWEQYTGILDALSGHRFPHSYDRGVLEIMSPSQKYEWDNCLIERLIQRLAEELEVEIVSLGSWTLGREELDKGLEPDRCFYVANEPVVRFNEAIDLDKDPPPDLAIEIDVTSSSIPRQSIYQALGVRELWRYAKGKLTFLQLSEGKYKEVAHSLAFPILSSEKLAEMIACRKQKSELQVVKQFVAWVREQQG